MSGSEGGDFDDGAGNSSPEVSALEGGGAPDLACRRLLTQCTRRSLILPQMYLAGVSVLGMMIKTTPMDVQVTRCCFVKDTLCN